MTSQNGESLHSSFKQPDLSNESSTLQPSFSFNTPQNITSNPELSSSLSGPRLQADRTVNTSSTASIDDIVDELLTQHQLPSAQPRTESDLREENTRLIQALTLLRKRNAYLKEREITLLKSQSQLRENQTQFSELQAQVAQRALELQTREKALESEREQLQQREQILAQREEYLKQWQTRLEQTEKQLEERLTQTQREWNAKHEELEALKIQQKEQLQEREEELNFLRQQLEQKEKMLDLQLQHYKLQVEQAKEKEQVLKKRQEMLDKQNEELKRRETNLTAKEREIEETSKDLQIKREHLTQLQQQLQQLQQQLQKQQLEKEVHLQEKAIEREKTETHELHSTTKLLERLKTLEAQHTILENEYQKVITQLRKSEELNEILQARQVALENELDYLKKEIQSKNEQFAKLSNQLKDTRLLSSPQTSTKASHEKIIVSSTKPQSSKEKIRRLIEELDNLRLASQAHQTQNAFLSQTINRLLEEKSTEAKAKKKTIEFYQRELLQIATQYRTLRQQVLLAEVQVPADVHNKLTDEFLKEVDEMKREFFFTLAIGIKLNRTLQGVPCNLDTQHLWEQAKHLHHSKWNEFLHTQFAQLQQTTSSQSPSNDGSRQVRMNDPQHRTTTTTTTTTSLISSNNTNITPLSVRSGLDSRQILMGNPPKR